MFRVKRDSHCAAPELSLALAYVTALGASVFALETQESWRDDAHRAVLRNDAIEAHLQSGLLVELKDAASGRVLVSVDPASLPAKMALVDRARGGRPDPERLGAFTGSRGRNAITLFRL